MGVGMAQGAARARTAVAREEAWIVNSARDAIVGTDEAGVITYCNPAAGRLYDYPLEQLIGGRAEMLLPPERLAEEAEVMRRILAGGEVPPYRTDRVCRDGTVVAVFLTISPIADAAGAIVGAATMVRRANIQDARDRFEARVDKQRLDAQSASDRFEVRVDQEREEARDAAVRFEVRVVAERAQARATEDGFQDRIDAERAQSQSDRDTLRGQLQQGQRLEVLGQLASGVAHDFNNLLAVILNKAAFVAEELAAGPRSDWESAGRDVAQIQQAAERVTTLTHQLLAFARREVVQPRVLDLNQVVTEVKEVLHRTLGEDVVLQTDMAENLWPVLADPGQIEQVLVNLAVNARDAMSGGGMLSIDTANAVVEADDVPGSPTRTGRYVRLRVSDTGTGMSAEVADHAFEPFFTTKADGTGTGLGLATVYGIVAQAEASIALHTQPGVGTTFDILIPATDEAAVPIQEPTVHHRTPTGEMVLVVEDEESLREVTGRIFTRGGYQVITAAGGQEAIALAAEYDGDIHLLVTDVVMPKMLGRQVAERIREVRPEIQVLYMSGYAQPVLAAQGRLDTGVDLIEKPFSAASLIEKAGQVLDGHFLGYQTVKMPRPAPSSPAGHGHDTGPGPGVTG
jgi:PAS domain S-box-containing protein